MKLEVWKEAIELFKVMHEILGENKSIDFRLRSQVLDAGQSVSSNIAEGYCRRTINEYLQFLGIAQGSSGEAMTRMIGFLVVGAITKESFERFDERHYSVENRLISLVKSLQAKRRNGEWEEEFR